MSMSGPDGHRNSPDGHSKDKVQLQNVVPGQMVVDGTDGGNLTRMILVSDDSLLTMTSKTNAGSGRFCKLIQTVTLSLETFNLNNLTTQPPFFIF